MSKNRKLTQYQRDMIEDYEQHTGFEFTGKDRIRNCASFWDAWDRNVGWIRRVADDVENLENPHARYRPSI